MFLISLFPHIYSLILTMLHPWQVNGLRTRLKKVRGEQNPSDDWIERAVFEDTMIDFLKAPSIAILPTVVNTIEANNLLLTVATVFIFAIVGTIFGLLRANWEPWYLNRTWPFFNWEISGRQILLLSKIAVVLLVSGITLIAKYFYV